MKPFDKIEGGHMRYDNAVQHIAICSSGIENGSVRPDKRTTVGMKIASRLRSWASTEQSPVFSFW